MSEHDVLELDCRGLACPRPVIELAKAAATAGAGRLVAILTTDPAATSDIPAWCRLRGQDYLGSEPLADGAIRHLVRLLS